MRLLIIEDDRELASAVSRGLSQQGYAVDTAADGEEGLYLADVNEYDLVLLDLNLPEMDGLEVLRHLRTGNAELPVLILTARGRTEERVKGLDFGADDYLVKPFQFEELCARLRALMRRDAKSRSPVLRCKDLALDPASHTAWRGRRRLELTRKEFGVLEYLMRQSGNPVTQEETHGARLEQRGQSVLQRGSGACQVASAETERRCTVPNVSGNGDWSRVSPDFDSWCGVHGSVE